MTLHDRTPKKRLMEFWFVACGDSFVCVLENRRVHNQWIQMSFNFHDASDVLAVYRGVRKLLGCSPTVYGPRRGDVAVVRVIVMRRTASQLQLHRTNNCAQMDTTAPRAPFRAMESVGTPIASIVMTKRTRGHERKGRVEAKYEYCRKY